MKTTKKNPAAEESFVLCPFCANGTIPAEPGKTACMMCGAEFELDDQAECVFVNLADPRLPINGTYCRSCGLIQSEHSKECFYCWEPLRTEWQ